MQSLFLLLLRVSGHEVTELLLRPIVHEGRTMAPRPAMLTLHTRLTSGLLTTGLTTGLTARLTTRLTAGLTTRLTTRPARSTTASSFT